MDKKELENIKVSEDIIEYIKVKTNNSKDIYFRKLDVLDEDVYIVYNECMTSTDLISNYVIRSLDEISKSDVTKKKLENIDINLEKERVFNGNNNGAIKKKEKRDINYKEIKQKLQLFKDKSLIDTLEKTLSICKVKKLDLKQDDMMYYIFSGFTLIINNAEILAVETKGKLDRGVSETTTEVTVKGPKESFIENYQTNIGLIRKRIKDEKLVLEESKIGRRSKTKVGILYIDDIAKPEFVNYVKSKLKKVDIDAILDSNYVVEILEDSNKSDFPVTISTERPDLSSFYLLQGRVVLIVENSPFAIVVPVFMDDFLNNMDDYYQKHTNVNITKIVRVIAFFITLFTPALYVALITFDQEAIPTQLLISFVTQREGVPFPAFLEAILMILSFEILRECDYRTPNVAGNTLSIVGALILGDAAVSAGIVSPIMIIVIAITMIAGLMFNDINIVNALRKWRIINLFFASIAGLLGVGISILLFISKACSVTSFTKPYTYPLAPFNFTRIGEILFSRKDISKDTKRQKILTDNLVKYRK